MQIFPNPKKVKIEHCENIYCMISLIPRPNELMQRAAVEFYNFSRHFTRTVYTDSHIIQSWSGLPKCLGISCKAFSGFSVGCCINEEKIICCQLELGKQYVSTECSSRHQKSIYKAAEEQYHQLTRRREEREPPYTVVV